MRFLRSVACAAVVLGGATLVQAGTAKLCVRGPNPIEFNHLLGAFAPPGVEVTIYNCGDSQEDLHWSSNLSGDLAPFVTVTPSSGTIKPGQGINPHEPSEHSSLNALGPPHPTAGQQTILVAVNPLGLGAASLSGLLKVINLDDAANSEPIALGLTVGATTFIPGDTLIGEMDSAGDVEAAAYNGLAGLTLKLKIKGKGGPDKLRLTILDENDIEVKSWTIPTSKTRNKKFTQKTTGLYKLRIESGDGSTGPYEILTDRSLPKRAKPTNYVKATPKKGETFVEVEVDALPGALLSANFLPVAPLEPGEIGIQFRTPLGQVFDTSAFDSESLVGQHLVLVPLGVLGTWTLRVDGLTLKGDRVTIPVIPHQPLGEATVNLDI